MFVLYHGKPEVVAVGRIMVTSFFEDRLNTHMASDRSRLYRHGAGALARDEPLFPRRKDTYARGRVCAPHVSVTGAGRRFVSLRIERDARKAR